MLLPEPLRGLDLMTQEVSSHQHRIRVVKEQLAFSAAHPPAKAGFGRTDRTKSMHANCYAAFNRNWLGLRRRVGVESSFAGPQSRDFKR